MLGSDYEGALLTHVRVTAAQLDWAHELVAYASFSSGYEYSNVKGTWHLIAQLEHSWATDEEPYDKEGKIVGKKGGMSEHGSQKDRDWLTTYDPSITIWDCDAFAKAKVYHPTENKHYRAVAAPFFSTTSTLIRKRPGDISPDEEEDIIDIPDRTPDDDDDDDDDPVTPFPDPTPAPRIYLVNADQIPEPGDSATLTLVTSEPYYNVSWYVKAPWETNARGTYIEDDYGDGTSTTASLTYTFPSGSMHTGDFLITASIYRWSDMSEYGEETYTVTVDMTPNCSDCTDESINCPNANNH